MNAPEKVLRYYVLCNRLKDVVRTGWKDWEVSRERVESIAEHVYSVQMLAIAMQSEYKYDIDFEKVLKMLAVHETEEIIIGDLTIFDICREEKEKIGHEAVKKIFKNLDDGESFVDLIFEFDARETAEAKFAYWCDKLEADLQARVYDIEHDVDPTKVKENERNVKNADVKRLLDSGFSWGQMWLRFGQERYDYDKNFTEVSKFAEEHDILKYRNDK